MSSSYRPGSSPPTLSRFAATDCLTWKLLKGAKQRPEVAVTQNSLGSLAQRLVTMNTAIIEQVSPAKRGVAKESAEFLARPPRNIESPMRASALCPQRSQKAAKYNGLASKYRDTHSPCKLWHRQMTNGASLKLTKMLMPASSGGKMTGNFANSFGLGFALRRSRSESVLNLRRSLCLEIKRMPTLSKQRSIRPWSN